MWKEILYCGGAYLSGSVLYAPLLGKCFGVDPRKTGTDGNPGAANAFRSGGVLLGILVLLFDFLKGFIPVFLLFEKAQRLQTILAIAPVAGHVFPVFFHFKGGKGIATTFGIWGGLTYWVIPSILGSTFSAFLLLRHLINITLSDHLAVTIGMIHLSGWTLLRYGHPYFLIALFNTALLIFTHRHEFRRKGQNYV
ncbi:MAG: glycerol-3-phosphate acyltransferase [Atribacterota bacterium]